ncbi:MAG: malectin domain-containing carbohydrate-binding protein [Candidatus Acidiferrales bacterium]
MLRGSFPARFAWRKGMAFLSTGKIAALASATILFLLCFIALPALAQVSVTTQHNDLNRSGDNLSETTLTHSNVNSTQFGKLFTLAVDNQVYSQPLVVAGVSIGGGTHNVVYVTTTANSVYAFDADTGTQYWHVNLGTPITNAAYGTGCVDIDGDAGIVGTSVVDTANNSIYVVNSLNSGGYKFMLHSLNLSTGADNSGSPVQITATGFVATAQNARAALTLANGNIYIPFSSHCDMGTYHGFLFSYNPTTLAQNAVFNTSPTGNADSLWMSGQGPSVDASGNIYTGTSNGTWDGVSNFSESFLKLSPSLALGDWFTAANHASLDGGDEDLDTTGPLLVPGSTRLIMVGKSDVGYVINSANLGHLGDASAVQTLTFAGGMHGSFVYFNSAANGPEVYGWAVNDALKAFQYNGNDLNTPNFQSSPETTVGNPGAYMAISANGTSNGILWANAVLSGSAEHGETPGVLRAYNADNIATELYNNQQNASRDSCGYFAKNGYPTIANGKVYLGSFGTTAPGQGQVCVYGLLTTSCSAAPSAPSGLGATATSSSQINLSWTASTAGSGCSISYSIFRSTTSGFTPGSGNQIASGVSGTTYSDTGLASSTTYYYLVEAVDSAGTSGASNQASATTQSSTTGGQIIAINSGGPLVSPFVADEDFTGGATTSHPNTINTSNVTNPAPAAVYQTGRDGNFSYTIPGFTAGTNYVVRLHFCETYFTTSGSRTFNVSINGTQVLSNFDIFATAGGQNIANIQQFTMPANSSGQFVIVFTSVINNSLVSGIEIDSTTSSCSGAPTAPSGLGATAISSSQINLGWTASTAGTGCSITYSVFRSTTSGFTAGSGNQIATGVTATAYSDTGLAASTTYYYLVEGVDSAGSSAASNQASATTSASSGSCTSICIDSGSTTAVSPFVADIDFTGGTTIDHANTINTSMVTNPAPAAVYQTARVANFTYTIGGFTANSSHNVRLHFCETYFSTAGSRTFNVSINGTQVLTGFDIEATAGGKNIANIQQFSEAANSSGQYVIVFTSVVNQSLISGIEID